MNREYYEKAKKDFKAGWEEAALLNNKGSILESYRSRCPACSIADKGHYGCLCCPVTKWRNLAKKGLATAPCTVKGQLYQEWADEHLLEKRASLALAISKLQWRWLPEYED